MLSCTLHSQNKSPNGHVWIYQSTQLSCSCLFKDKFFCTCYSSLSYLSNLDKLGEVLLEFLPLEGLVEALLTLVPVLTVGILDAGRSNQGLKTLE